MTPPVQPIRPSYNRAAAKALGATDAEIDALIAEHEAQQAEPRRFTRPDSQSFASESSAASSVKPEEGKLYANDPIALARAAVPAFGTQIEAGMRSLGSDRSYADLRDDIKGQKDEFRRQHPVAATAANIAGNLAVAPLIPSLPFKGAKAVGTWAQAAQGAGRGAANGIVQGAGSGFLANDGTLDERINAGAKGALVGGAVGGVIGGALPLATAALRGVKDKAASFRAARAYDRGDIKEVPFLTDEQTAEAFERTRRKSGVSMEELRAQQHDPSPNTIGSQLGKAGIDRSGTAYRRGLNEPQRMAETLDARAADEAPNLYAKGKELTGRDIRDTEAFRKEGFDQVKPEVTELWRQAGPRAVPRDASEPIVSKIEQLRRDGVDVWGNTRTAYEDFPATAKPFLPKGEAPPKLSTILDETGKPFERAAGNPATLNVGELRQLRESLDKMIDYSGQPLADNSTKAAQTRLKALRVDLDELIKGEGPGKGFGGAEAKQADVLHSTAAKRGRSFEQGNEVITGVDPRSDTGEGLASILKESDPEALQAGAASEMLNRIRKASDGSTGGVANPGRGVVGSPITDARAQQAFLDRPENFSKFKDEARQVTARLRERQSIMGGSQTAERGAHDQADAIGEAAMMLAHGRPVAAVKGVVGQKWDAVARRFTGQQLDAEARILMAGAPGQMSRPEALDLLEAARKLLMARGAQTVKTAGTAGGAAGRAAAIVNQGRR